MEAWESFAVAQVGAAAVLAGLIFVGVSVNLDRVLAIAGIPGRAAEALIILLGLLVAATLLLVPGQSVKQYGWELIVIGALTLGGTMLLAVRSRPGRTDPLWGYFVLRVALCVLATVPYIIGGVTTLRAGEAGLWWLAVATIGTFLASFLDAWVLLIEIKR